jgi:hypothetical protein
MGCVFTSNGAMKFFVVKKQLLDDYEDKDLPFGSIFIRPLHHMCPYYGVGWNIIKNNLNNFNKGNFLNKGGLSPLLQYFKCDSKGGVWYGCHMEQLKEKNIHIYQMKCLV